MDRKIIKEIETWVNCIGAWKETSKLTDRKTYFWSAGTIKEEGLKRIGKNNRVLRLCFFCDFERETGFCPLGKCNDYHCTCLNDYNYGKWEKSTKQKDAKIFYYELWFTFLNRISERN